jgi:pimeloyl-ACP methyl ester carboxylesterase
MTMFPTSDGLALAYDDRGTGPAIVLVHGFASNRQTNWIGPGWYDALLAAGHRVVALDLRGHGRSDKPHESAAYDETRMARDVVELLDHLSVTKADYMGYSMGGFIGVSALGHSSQRLGRVVLAGIGQNYTGEGIADPSDIAEGLRAPSLDQVSGAVPRQFRRFAEASGNDLLALAACMLRPRRSLTAGDLTHVRNEVLVITGEKDTISGPPEPLAAIFPRGQCALIPQRDHMNAVGDKAYKATVLSFLAS